MSRYPSAVYAVEGRTLSVQPASPDGFTVSLTETDGEYVVAYEGWHEHFYDEDEALNCFAFGLSERCRLRIDYRGEQPYRWTVEEQTPDGWSADSCVGLLISPFWRRRRTEYRQNALIRTAAEPGAAGGRGPHT